ncbi:hypothetical protein HBB16_15840 [Pseudonocardia sp. MCCB 268]|nr:hypothetical protein [Pseudonocardia cytotoxica]
MLLRPGAQAAFRPADGARAQGRPAGVLAPPPGGPSGKRAPSDGAGARLGRDDKVTSTTGTSTTGTSTTGTDVLRPDLRVAGTACWTSST